MNSVFETFQKLINLEAKISKIQNNQPGNLIRNNSNESIQQQIHVSVRSTPSSPKRNVKLKNSQRKADGVAYELTSNKSGKMSPFIKNVA